jgi:heme exporter protein D
MPELGKYAGAVLGSYAATIALLAALIGLSLWQSRRIRQALRRAEERVGKADV